MNENEKQDEQTTPHDDTAQVATTPADARQADAASRDAAHVDTAQARATTLADALAEDASKAAPLRPAAPGDDRAWLWPVAMCLIAMSCALVFWHTKTGAVRNTNVGSRYATVEALVNHGTYVIDDTAYVHTIDKVQLNGHFLSSKPPLLPTTTAGVYWLYKRVTGKDIRTDERSVVTFCNVVMVGVPHALLLLYFFRFLTLLCRRPEAILVGLIGAGFASLEVGYAVELNNHSVAASVALIAFYYAYRIRNGIDPKDWYWYLCGGLCGLMPGLDVPSTFIVFCIFVYLFLHDRQKTLTRFLPATLPGVIVHFILTYIASGSLIPVYMRKEAYDYPGSYWRKPRGIDALDEPKHVYAFHVLLGHHGLFSMTPPFVFSALALFRTLRERRERLPEALIVTASLLVLTLFYIGYTNNYGGGCVGMRWLIVLMPMLFLFFAVYIELFRPSRWGWALIVASLFISHYHVEDTFWTPWHNSRWHQGVERALKSIGL